MSLPDIHDVTQGRWAGLLPQYGVPTPSLNGKHHPCPLCGGTDRFRWDDRLYKGKGGYICNQCGPGTGIDLVMKITGKSFLAVADEVRVKAGDVKPTWKRAAASTKWDSAEWVAKTWASAAAIEPGTAAGLHLRRRGVLTDNPPTQLRYLPKAKYNHGEGIAATYHPAMVAQFVSPDGAKRTLHFTYLDQDGRKARLDPCRKFGPGLIPKGGAVRLSASAETMGIAEGIETALSAAALHDVPVWAALNKGELMTWEPPAHVKCVLVFGDNDANCAGQTAAYHLANRLICSPRKLHAEVRLPALENTDWNDLHTTEGATA